MAISENKLKHSLGVARECRKLARELNLPQQLVDACFIMGLLHDVGYEDDETTTHPMTSEGMVYSFLKYAQDIATTISHHGNKYYAFGELDYILNKADLTVSYDGESVSMDKRLKGIAERYGVDSTHYNNAVSMKESVESYEVVHKL